MKKILLILLVLLLTFSLCACQKSSSSAKKTIYIMGPTPDHGWTAQVGSFAEKKSEEINNEGTYKAVYMSASSGEDQVDQVNTIVANGDASVVVMLCLEDSAQAGQETLHAEGIPFISFDRIIDATEKYALLNYSGDNWQCGAGAAHWMQQNGMTVGSTVMVLYGDNGTVCTRRQEGFEQFLRGDTAYTDSNMGSFETTEVWTQDQLDSIFSTYYVVCGWSSDVAYGYMEQKLEEIVQNAKNNGGKLYINSMDDELIFGVMNYLNAGASEALKADFQALDVYITGCGPMQELLDVMSGKDEKEAAIADAYFDGMATFSYSPGMIQTAIDLGLSYLSGDWSYEKGSSSFEPTFMVDRSTAATAEGFFGH